MKNGLKKDYIKLIYADDDILYLPVEKIDKISKFSGNADAIVRLDKLGSDNWEKRKERVRKQLKNIANDLIKISAEREAMKDFLFLKMMKISYYLRVNLNMKQLLIKLEQ